DGEVSGDRLDFQWSDPINGDGWGIFYLAEDGNTLRGKWGVQPGAKMGEWNAVRLKPCRGEPTVWLVRGRVREAGEVQGRATLCSAGNRVTGRLEGVYLQVVQAGATSWKGELPVINELEGTQTEERIDLKWRNPIDGSEGTIVLIRQGPVLEGTWQTESEFGSLILSRPVASQDLLDVRTMDRLAGEAAFQNGARLYLQHRYREAIAEYQKAVDHLRKARLPDKLGRALVGLASAQLAKGEHDQARLTFHQALALGPALQETDRILAEAGLGMIDQLYSENPKPVQMTALQGSPEMAEEQQKSLGDIKREGLQMVLSGDLEAGIAALENGLENSQKQSTPAGEKSQMIDKATILGFLGTAYYSRTNRGYQESGQAQALKTADLTKSIEYHLKSLELWGILNSPENQATELTQLALRHKDLGDADQAEMHLKQGLDVQEDIESPDQWLTHYFLADTYRATGRRSEAFDSYENCLMHLEIWRSKQFFEETKIADFLRSVQHSSGIRPYEAYVEYLYEAEGKKPALKALEVADRGRARTLADLLNQQLDPLHNAAIAILEGTVPALRIAAASAPVFKAEEIPQLVEDSSQGYLIYFVTREAVFAWLLTNGEHVQWIRLPITPKQLGSLVKDLRSGCLWR
ncbi:MAG: hypothetical protein V3T83_04375, partial [Acidobacteriota bacterium]